MLRGRRLRRLPRLLRPAPTPRPSPPSCARRASTSPSTACRRIRRWAAADRRLARRPAAQHLHRLSRRRAGAADLPRARAPGGVRARRHAVQRVVRDRGREASARERWLGRARRAPQARAEYARGEARRADFRALTVALPRRARRRCTRALRATPPSARGKAALLARMRADYAALKAARWGGYAGYDALVRRAPTMPRSACSAATPRWCRRSSACSSARAATSRASTPRCGASPPCRRPSAAPRSSAKLADLPHPTPETVPWPTSTSTASTALGLAKARKVAWKWAETVEQKFGMECTVIEGETSDVVEFTRTGVDGRLIVAADHFDLTRKLGFLLGAFAGTIETEIEKNLDTLLARARRAPKKAPAKKTAARHGASRAPAAGHASLQRFDQVDVLLHRLVARLALERRSRRPTWRARPCRRSRGACPPRRRSTPACRARRASAASCCRASRAGSSTRRRLARTAPSGRPWWVSVRSCESRD